MTVFKSASQSVGHYPDDKDLYALIFEYFPSYRLDPRGSDLAMLIDEETGRKYTFDECKQRTDWVAAGLRDQLGVRRDTVVSLFSANSVDYIVAILACHKLGAVVSCANPSYEPSELAYQLDASKATIMIVGQENVQSGVEGAEKAGIRRDHVVVMQTPSTCQKDGALSAGGQKRFKDGAWTLEGLAAEGKESAAKRGKASLDEGRHVLQSGEARSKLAFLSFSSGTTGLPKAVQIQHYAPVSNVQQMTAFNGMIGGQDQRFSPGKHVSLGCLPFYHIYGLVIVLFWTFFSGVTTVVVPKFRGIEALIKTTLKYRIDCWWLVPPQVVLLVKDPSAQPYLPELRKILRFVMIGAAPLSNDLSAQLEKTLPDIDWGQGYGMTECATLLTMHPPGMRPVLGSAGRLVSDVEALVVNSEGKKVGVGETGELWVRGPSNTLGYLNNAKATEEMWTKEGWIRTGDEVTFNAEGDMFILDRLKELIKVKGFQVPPAELEGWILNHEDVADCGVIGFPDESSGEIPLAFVMLSSAAAQRLDAAGDRRSDEEKKIKASIMRSVAENKIRYKHLGGVEFIDAIPKNPSGKLLRRQLRDVAKKLPPLEKAARSKL